MRIFWLRTSTKFTASALLLAVYSILFLSLPGCGNDSSSNPVGQSSNTTAPVIASPTPATPQPETQGKSDQVLLYDPLTNGSSLGDIGGGEFTDQGWKVIASSNFIVYDMEPIETGFFEFDITNLPLRNPSRDARHLFFMWDPSVGSNMTSNPFRVSLQKLDGRSSINNRWTRLRFISGNRQQDFGKYYRKWAPEKTFRIRLEWGQEGNVNVGRLFIASEEIFFFQYAKPYILGTHRIELGAAPRAETHEDAIYSNVIIGTR